MKKCFTLIAAAVMAFAANAQDLLIPVYFEDNPNVQLEDGRFNPITKNIGNTGAGTVIGIGEVDFSENYQAVGLAFANGWDQPGSDPKRFAILSAGADLESALPFAQIALAYTQTYDNYMRLASNLVYNVTDPTVLSGGKLAIEGLSFTKPEGKQKVFITFVEGAGNIQSVHFYKNAFAASDFHGKGDWEPVNTQVLLPRERADYNSLKTTLLQENSVVVAKPEGNDTHVDGPRGWGWTTGGVVVDYGTMDFGNGEYTQVAAEIRHGGQSPENYIEFYLDEVTEENMIARTFTGFDVNAWDNLYQQGANFNRVVTGSHKVLVKWVGGGTNVRNIDIVKGNLWLETPNPDPIVLKVNETPSENAKWYTMRNDVPEGATKIQNHAGLNQAQPDGGGNYGWTNNKSVIKFGGIDFENGQYNRAILGYSTGSGNWMDYKEFANISLYIDLEKDGKTYDWNNAHEALADVEPVAVIRHQATGGWSNVYNIGDELAKVTGVHDVYLVYYQANTNEGANIFDLFLDTQVPAKEPKITGISIKGQEIALEEGVKNYALTLTEDFQNEDVVVTTVDAEDLVLSIKIEEVSMMEADEYLVTIELLDDAGAPVDSYTVNVTVEKATGINDINVVNTKAYKTIQNGQVVIVKGDKMFNVLGQPVK